MRLVFLYGPPAAGKLTVARALASLTGLRVFHNHLAIDLAQEIFPEGGDGYGRLVTRLRLEAFAAEDGVSLVSTFVYGAGEDDAFVEEARRAVAGHGGRFCPVQLLPERGALRHRVNAISRHDTSKLRDGAILERLIDEHDLTTPIPGSLTIDNSDRMPREVAVQIAEWLVRQG